MEINGFNYCCVFVSVCVVLLSLLLGVNITHMSDWGGKKTESSSDVHPAGSWNFMEIRLLWHTSTRVLLKRSTGWSPQTPPNKVIKNGILACVTWGANNLIHFTSTPL